MLYKIEPSSEVLLLFEDQNRFKEKIGLIINPISLRLAKKVLKTFAKKREEKKLPSVLLYFPLCKLSRLKICILGWETKCFEKIKKKTGVITCGRVIPYLYTLSPNGETVVCKSKAHYCIQKVRFLLRPRSQAHTVGTKIEKCFSF